MTTFPLHRGDTRPVLRFPLPDINADLKGWLLAAVCCASALIIGYAGYSKRR